ncbi:trimeric intracellular cation channel family protein [Amycolatopsis pithecellobii]|uniref:Trimeric intracellular cation channel family protein n=1 Tax=Amycolatopsis pithecellobii TaxID=664692 RepID=A0A6N7YZA9_9PSEU|nr:trimeric intracellular cation channel family protein [Amycolatopsis pithecellobii]MTD57258.1 trimeric intracellular cation channel family protein [Amycolatopsis pithecellobii]
MIPELLSLIGIAAFAVSGAVVGVRRRLDLLGVVVVGLATGTGGGVLRDLALNVSPPAAFTHWPTLAVAVGASLGVFVLHGRLSRLRRLELVFDAFGMGLFAATGASYALDRAAGPMAAVLIGTLTAVGGGVIRDVLVNEIPIVLRRELYAISALAGAVLTVALVAATGSLPLSTVAGVILAVGLRLISLWRGWHLPAPKNR